MLFLQVVNKWLALQAMSDVPGNVEHVRGLLEHPAFDIRNPNKVRLHGSACFILATISPSVCVACVLIWFLSNCSSAPQVYSLIGGFCASAVNFHAKDGSGYKFLADIVLQLDQLNPQVGSTHYAYYQWCRRLSAICVHGWRRKL
jgi:aminopeptidase N